MNTKYSPTQRENYGRQLAAHLCDQHFGARPTATLDGLAVLRFTPIRQVNLFVVQALLGKWTAEMAQLRSVYFDFEDADVRQALTQFMNVLSRRIRLSRPTFEPLLTQAVADALAGALDPAETLAVRLLPAAAEATGTTPEQLREGLRYLDTHQALFTRFVETLPAGRPHSRTELLSDFARYQAGQPGAPEPATELLNQLAELRPLPEGESRGATSTTLLATPAMAAPVVASVPPTPAPIVAALPVAAPAPAVAPQPSAPASAPVAAVPTPTPAPISVPLYAKLKAEHAGAPSLSETLRPERAATLAEKAPHVESLREAISINQRFSFINELFGGENMQYHAAIQHLDSLPDAGAAKRYVNEHLATTHDWTRKEEHVGKLLRLIDRKFSA